MLVHATFLGAYAAMFPDVYISLVRHATVDHCPCSAKQSSRQFAVVPSLSPQSSVAFARCQSDTPFRNSSSAA